MSAKRSGSHVLPERRTNCRRDPKRFQSRSLHVSRAAPSSSAVGRAPDASEGGVMWPDSWTGVITVFIPGVPDAAVGQTERISCLFLQAFE